MEGGSAEAVKCITLHYVTSGVFAKMGQSSDLFFDDRAPQALLVSWLLGLQPMQWLHRVLVHEEEAFPLHRLPRAQLQARW